MYTIENFKIFIDTIDKNNINNLQDDQIINLMEIYEKLIKIFIIDDDILNLYLPHIIYTSILSKNKDLNQDKKLEYHDLINNYKLLVECYKL